MNHELLLLMYGSLTSRRAEELHMSFVSRGTEEAV
jgi:hypothetical protein